MYKRKFCKSRSAVGCAAIFVGPVVPEILKDRCVFFFTVKESNKVVVIPSVLSNRSRDKMARQATGVKSLTALLVYRFWYLIQGYTNIYVESARSVTS